MSTIGERLKKARGGRPWREIERAAKISPRALERILYPDALERGKRGPTLETIRSLAQACGVSPGWLAFGDGSDDGTP